MAKQANCWECLPGTNLSLRTNCTSIQLMNAAIETRHSLTRDGFVTWNSWRITYLSHMNERWDDKVTLLTHSTGWREVLGCLVFTCHFPQKNPTINSSFAENDLRLKASYASSPSVRNKCHAPQVVTRYSWRMAYLSHMNECSLVILRTRCVSHVTYNQSWPQYATSYMCHSPRVVTHHSWKMVYLSQTNGYSLADLRNWWSRRCIAF